MTTDMTRNDDDMTRHVADMTADVVVMTVDEKFINGRGEHLRPSGSEP